MLSDKSNGNLIFLISPCRSGSTALLYGFSQIPTVFPYYQPIKGAIRERKKFVMPDISHGYHLFKETIGHENMDVCSYNPFEHIPSDIRINAIFLFRNPVNTWESWKKMGWNPNLGLFIHAYSNAYNLLKKRLQTHPESTSCIIYDSLENTEIVSFIARTLCKKIGLPYTSNIIQWKHTPSIKKFIFLSNTNKIVAQACSEKLIRTRGIRRVENGGIIFTTISESNIIKYKLGKKYSWIYKQFEKQFGNNGNISFLVKNRSLFENVLTKK